MTNEFLFDVNGYTVRAEYDQEDVDKVFKPLIRKIIDIYKEKKRRIFVFLAAPPGAGKSTLVLFLNHLLSQEGFDEAQSVGIDGFHYYSEYLKTHYTEADGKKVLMKEVKGNKNTFDTDKIYQKLKEASQGNTRWPLYDRNLHDPIEDVIEISKPVILFEGNYLLLNDEKWARLREFADYTIMMTVDKDILKTRCVQRKAKGGLSIEEASRWFEKVDGENVDTVLNESVKADCNISFDGNNYHCDIFE